MDRNPSIFARYRKIILAVIFFMIADAVVIGINFFNTFKADESAVSINLSGRQRMMSQRMTKALLAMERTLEAGNEADLQTTLKELTLTVRRFDRTLMGFRDGAMVTGGDDNPVFLTQVDTDASRKFIEDAYAIWTPYMKLLEPLINSDRDSIRDERFKTKHTDTTLEDVKSRFRAEEVFTDEEFGEKLAYIKNNPDQFRTDLGAVVSFALAPNPAHGEPQNNRALLKLMNDLTTDLERVANQRASTLRLILSIGILVALFNFGYTVIVSIQDLTKGDLKLAEARQETTEILSTVREGLLLLDQNKRIGTQFSASLSGILQRDIQPGMDFMPHLQAIASKEVSDAAKDYIELLLGDRVKESLVTSLNPLTNVSALITAPDGTTQVRYLSFFFNRVATEKKSPHLLVTIQDVTDKVVLAEKLEQSKHQAKLELETLLRLANSDFDTLQQFVYSVKESLTHINEKMSEPTEGADSIHTLNYIMRAIHGIKGESAVLGIDVLESYAHDCEKEMAEMREEESFSGESRLRVAVLLDGFYERHAAFAQIVARLGEALGKTSAPASAVPAEAAPKKHPFEGQITMLAERIAKDHGKQIKVFCQFEKLLSLPQPIVKNLQGISTQLVRNALAHGIETPNLRATRNKPSTGALSLWCEYLGNGQYTFTVRDDGCGIVPNRLREYFVKKGILNAEQAAAMRDNEIAAYLFRPGVSTAEVADQDSGHGIGLDIVWETVRAMGGHMQVKTRANQFTEFNIQFRADPVAEASA